MFSMKKINLIFNNKVDGVFVLLVDEGLDGRADALDAQQLQLILFLSTAKILRYLQKKVNKHPNSWDPNFCEFEF